MVWGKNCISNITTEYAVVGIYWSIIRISHLRFCCEKIVLKFSVCILMMENFLFDLFIYIFQCCMCVCLLLYVSMTKYYISGTYLLYWFYGNVVKIISIIYFVFDYKFSEVFEIFSQYSLKYVFYTPRQLIYPQKVMGFFKKSLNKVWIFFM